MGRFALCHSRAVRRFVLSRFKIFQAKNRSVADDLSDHRRLAKQLDSIMLEKIQGLPCTLLDDLVQRLDVHTLPYHVTMAHDESIEYTLSKVVPQLNIICAFLSHWTSWCNKDGRDVSPSFSPNSPLMHHWISLSEKNQSRFGKHSYQKSRLGNYYMS